jgi:hypothetical protein
LVAMEPCTCIQQIRAIRADWSVNCSNFAHRGG